jgi:hypothetical protein
MLVGGEAVIFHDYPRIMEIRLHLAIATRGVVKLPSKANSDTGGARSTVPEEVFQRIS